MSQSNADIPSEGSEQISKPRMSRSASVDWRVLPADEQALVRCTPDGHLYLAIEPTLCDACPFCRDICDLEDCANCIEKVKRIGPNDPKTNRYTLCQVRRCRNLKKCWVVAGSTIYDATSILIRHPGGLIAIMRYAGGSDCTEHFSFHSSRAQSRWKSLKIGEICYCEGSKNDPHSPPEHGDGLCVIS
jgi:hypothetical protein